MTSPVDTTVKYFDSTMPNAPVLSGTAGALIALLDACLKDGFNTITLTSLVVSGGVATASWTGTHAALKDTVVQIAGVTGALTALNGEQKVTSKPNSTSLTFATAAADGTAAGAITMKMAPMGFTKPFSGTNLAAYKSGDVTSTGMLLRLDDTGTTSARVVGYESMSDINTGSNPFPSAAQMSGGGYWVKSLNANSTAVAWALIGDSRCFFLHVQPGYSSGVTIQMGANRFFGDIIAYKPSGDAYGCALNYSATSTVGGMNDQDISSGFTATLQTAFPRDYPGVGSAVLYGMSVLFDYSTANTSGLTGRMGGFPSPVDGALWLSPKVITTSFASPPRGAFPGCHHAMQSGTWTTFKLGDRTPGSGALAGRNLVAVTTSVAGMGSVSSSINTGNLFFDITGPWR